MFRVVQVCRVSRGVSVQWELWAWKVQFICYSWLQTQPAALASASSSAQKQTCLLLLLFTHSSPHPICLSLLLFPLPSPSLFHLPLIPCKRLIILTGSAMAFIFLRQPRNLCEHLLWHSLCSLTNQIGHFFWSGTARNVRRIGGGNSIRSSCVNGQWSSIQLGCHEVVR